MVLFSIRMENPRPKISEASACLLELFSIANCSGTRFVAFGVAILQSNSSYAAVAWHAPSHGEEIQLVVDFGDCISRSRRQRKLSKSCNDLLDFMHTFSLDSSDDE